MQILYYKSKYQKYSRLLRGFLLLSGQGAAVTCSDVTWCVKSEHYLEWGGSNNLQRDAKHSPWLVQTPRDQFLVIKAAHADLCCSYTWITFIWTKIAAQSWFLNNFNINNSLQNMSFEAHCDGKGKCLYRCRSCHWEGEEEDAASVSSTPHTLGCSDLQQALINLQWGLPEVTKFAFLMIICKNSGTVSKVSKE